LNSQFLPHKPFLEVARAVWLGVADFHEGASSFWYWYVCCQKDERKARKRLHTQSVQFIGLHHQEQKIMFRICPQHPFVGSYIVWHFVVENFLVW